MRTAVYLIAFLAALLVAPAVHATTYLSEYGSGGGYMSRYSGGGSYYYSPNGSGYIGGLTSGAGSIDRTAARSTSSQYIIIPTPTHSPCGIYNRVPTSPCRMKTMAYNPKATVSRTGKGFNVQPLSSLPPYFGRRLGNIGILPYAGNFVQPQAASE